MKTYALLYIASYAASAYLGFAEYSFGWLIPISFVISIVVYTYRQDVGIGTDNTDDQMVKIVSLNTLFTLLSTGFVYWLGSLFN